MKKIFVTILALTAVAAAQAAVKLTVYNTRYQTITGFGAACCDGAMKPHGTDTKPVKLLYGEDSPVGLNIMRMEISPSTTGDNWGDYDWNGSLPSAKEAKKRGAIVFGTPWSPPPAYKTNNSAQGGNAEDQGNVRATLKEDAYSKFFPWLNTFLKWMKSNGVLMDAVSIQNEPDWWVNYSGCLYTPDQQLKLVKNYADKLDRKTYPGVRLISAEPFAFNPEYSNKLLNDPVAREYIDIVGGHIYGSAPLANMKSAAVLAAKYGKEVWMTENSVTDRADHLPTWMEQLDFADVVNECMLAGCTGYIYWYMRAHWAFVGTGESQYNPGNTKNTLLPRAYVMSHFSKHLPGATRLDTNPRMTEGEQKKLEYSAYIKGDSLIVMAINKFDKSYDLNIVLPSEVKSGKHIVSTSNTSLCQESPIDINEPTSSVMVTMGPQSLNTWIFMINKGETAINHQTRAWNGGATEYYDLRGRRLSAPGGFCVERHSDGSSRVVFIGR